VALTGYTPEGAYLQLALDTLLSAAWTFLTPPKRSAIIFFPEQSDYTREKSIFQ